MPLNAASRTAHFSAPGAHSPLLVDTLGVIGDFFRITSPAEYVGVLHRWLLLMLIAAGSGVRFWGLGDVGLHGDEETMGLAVRGILTTGEPIIPSGMFYPRGLTQLYLMALSVSLFGESEWALRLPSAICGAALLPIAYVAGRRFLQPHWNLAFVAALAFLPALIVDSQTARMYIFLITFITASMACLFTWERTRRTGWLIGSAAALILALDMHLLAVAVVLIFLTPGLVRGDARVFAFGAAALSVGALAYFLIGAFVNSNYPVPPPEFVSEIGARIVEPQRASQEFALTFAIVLWTAGLAVAFLALYVSRAIRVRGFALASAVLLLGGLALQLALFYHLAALSYLVGAVVAIRTGSPQVLRRLLIFAIAAAAIALVHVSLLAEGAGSLVRLVGALIGQPSAWPYVRIGSFSAAAGLLTAVLLGWGAYLIASNRKAPDYWLLAVLGVWAPVFALGLFAWNVPPRYTAMSLTPMLLCAFAFAQELVESLRSRLARWRERLGKGEAIVPALVAVCAVNPANVAATVDAGYRKHPDHQGAARFIQSQQFSDDDIVLAEDVLQQTYYLGRVDYWLIGPHIARRFVKRHDGKVVDFYTNTPVIATPAALEALLRDAEEKRIYVIGTGEGWTKGRRPARGDLHPLLESERFETIYTGRDGLTKVLKAVPRRSPKAE